MVIAYNMHSKPVNKKKKINILYKRKVQFIDLVSMSQ